MAGAVHLRQAIAISFVLALLAAAPYPTAATGEFTWREWWKNTIVYQIYPRSFMDNDADGVGDLNGITSRLAHLNEIGVGTIWLSPVYSSPMKDFGYDVSNFTAIDPIFGTMDDFDTMMSSIRANNLKLIMDYVPNHSSDQHPWFIESKTSRTNSYADYYIWQDPKADCTGSLEQCVPNNWVSVFGGSMWEWVPDRGQYYLHQFLKEQPDLNFRNVEVQEQMKSVLRFWFAKGVDGLRVDAIRHLFESEDLQDEPINPDHEPVLGEQAQYDSLIHTETADLPELHDVVKDWRVVFEEFSTDPNYKFMVTESYDRHANLLPYYGTDAQPEADFPFNFAMFELTSDNLSGNKIYELVDSWLKDLPSGKWPNWVIGNHDNSRVTDRLGKAYARAMNTLNLLLPGTPTTYYGEEITMEDIWVPYNKTQDPFAINNPEHWENYTRDPERSPMQWTSISPHASFSSIDGETWLPVNDNYMYGINVQDQTDPPNATSSMAHYKKLAALRKDEPAFQTSQLEYMIVDDKIFSFVRRPDDSSRDSFLVIINVGNTASTGDYAAALADKNLMVDANERLITLSSNPNRSTDNVLLNEITVDSGEALVVLLGSVQSIDGADPVSSCSFLLVGFLAMIAATLD